MSLNNFLIVQKNIYRLLGFNIFAEAEPFNRPYISAITIVPAVTLLGPMWSYAILNINDVNKVSACLASGMETVIILIKFWMLATLRHKIFGLLFRLKDFLINEYCTDEAFAEIIDRCNKTDQNICLVFIISIYIAWFYSAFNPLGRMCIFYYTTGSTEIILPYPTSYPWNNRKIGYYMFSYTWSLLCGKAVVLSCATDMLFNSLAYNISALFQIAQKRVIQLKPDDMDGLISVINFHNNILNMVNDLNSCYQPIIFITFASASFEICMLGVQILNKFNSIDIIFFMFFFIGVFIQLLIYSHCADIIRDGGLNFALGLYQSRWYECSAVMKNVIRFALMRAYIPCQIKGYFFEANIQTFSTILKSAASYVALLRSIG